jgi:hypothetical protein
VEERWLQQGYRNGRAWVTGERVKWNYVGTQEPNKPESKLQEIEADYRSKLHYNEISSYKQI